MATAKKETTELEKTPLEAQIEKAPKELQDHIIKIEKQVQ